MTESQKLVARGHATLKQQGWPDDAIRAIADLFMNAGALAMVENMQADKERDEQLIQRVQLVQMTLRELFINWLTASRFIKSLEARISEQRQDYTERLADKDTRINQLRTEVAGLKLECDRMRLVLLPFGSPAGAEYARHLQHSFHVERPPTDKPAFTPSDDWQAELNMVIAEEEKKNGLRDERQEAVHESGADATA